MRHELQLCFIDADLIVEVRDFEVREWMSRPFEIALTIKARAPIELGAVIGTAARFEMRSGPTVTFLGQGATRATSTDRTRAVDEPIADWSGIIADIEAVGVEKPLRYVYTVLLVHPLWCLGSNRNYRVYQHMSELDIARAIVAEWGIDENVLADPRAYKKRDFRIQYGESELTFFHRNLEDVGVSYFLQDSEEGEVVTFVSDPHKAPPRAGSLAYFEEPPPDARGEWAARVAVRRSVRPGRHTIQDVDYRMPPERQPRIASDGGGIEAALRPTALEQRIERFEYNPGAFAVEVSGPGDAAKADRLQKTRTDARYGAWLAETRLRSERTSCFRVSFETNAFDLHPGAVVRIDDHPRTELADPVLVIQTTLTGDDAGGWKMSCVAHPTKLPYVPDVVTPRPRSQGIESATVVGVPGDKIDPQELGSVLVQFHWDREGARDDKASCWVPVSYGLAGPGRGVFSLPRIGEEVLVAFLYGDLDKPMVTGRVYTALNRPWITDVAKMGDFSIKNDTLDDPSQNTGILMTADANPLLHLYTTFDKQLTVGNNQGSSVGRNRTATVGANCSTTVGGNRTTGVKANQKNRVDGRSSEIVQSTKQLQSDGSLSTRSETCTSIATEKSLSITSKQALTLSATTKLTVRGERKVTIKAKRAKLASGGDVIAMRNWMILQGGELYLNPGMGATKAAMETGVAPKGGAALRTAEVEQARQLKVRQNQADQDAEEWRRMCADPDYKPRKKIDDGARHRAPPAPKPKPPPKQNPPQIIVAEKKPRPQNVTPAKENPPQIVPVEKKLPQQNVIPAKQNPPQIVPVEKKLPQKVIPTEKRPLSDILTPKPEPLWFLDESFEKGFLR